MVSKNPTTHQGGIITFIQILIILTIAVVIFGAIILAYQAGQQRMFVEMQQYVAEQAALNDGKTAEPDSTKGNTDTVAPNANADEINLNTDEVVK